MPIARSAPARVAALFLAIAIQAGAASPQDAIRKVLDDQVAAWNRGDLVEFVEGYADSPDTLFVGKTVTRGRAGLLERYRKSFPTPARMGRLAFSGIEIRMLGSNYATVVGEFELTRAEADGGKAAGVFTLLFENTPAGWRIIQDHTS